jgi:hypothetical protein
MRASPVATVRVVVPGRNIERQLRVAIAAHQRLGARPWVALSQDAYAGVLRRRDLPGDRDQADAAEAAARRAGADLGMRLASA